MVGTIDIGGTIANGEDNRQWWDIDSDGDNRKWLGQ